MVVLKVVDGWETIAKCEVGRVQFWTWLSFSVLALVTDRCVYHWDIDQGKVSGLGSHTVFKSGPWIWQDSYSGLPLHRENRENSLSGKTQGIWKFAKTQGICFAQVVNSLILKVKDIFMFPGKIPNFWGEP